MKPAEQQRCGFLLTFLVALLLATALPVSGRVFQLKAAGGLDSILADTASCSRLYESSVRINGADGALTVYGSRESLSAVIGIVREACRQKNLDARLDAGPSMALGIIRDGDTVFRLVAIETDAPGSLFILVRQTRRDFERSQDAANARWTLDFPAYPGATVRLAITDENARATLNIAAVPASSGAALTFFDTALENAGWTPVSAPPSAHPDIPHFLFRVKGNAFCGILAQPAPGLPEQCVITVLHKDLQLK